jgi:streptogramin lyase
VGRLAGLALLAAGLLAAGGAAASGSARGTLVLVDPSRNAIVGRIPLAAEPLRVSYAAGAFWVVAPAARSVFRVDPRRRSAVRWKVGAEPYDAAGSRDAVWVADHDGLAVLRVELPRGTVSRARKLGVPELAIAHAFGSVWSVGADETLSRLDPSTLRVTGRVASVSSSTEGYEPKIAAAPGALWVSDAAQNRVTRIDPARLRVVERRQGAGNGVAVGAGGVWSAEGYEYVVRFAKGGQSRVRVGQGPIDVAVASGSVWVVTRFGRSLVRVDPKRLLVSRRIPLGGTAVAVAAGGGFLAVAFA